MTVLLPVIDPGSEDYLIFEILFWTGIREGELLALSLSDFDMSGNQAAYQQDL